MLSVVFAGVHAARIPGPGDAVSRGAQALLLAVKGLYTWRKSLLCAIS